MLEYIYIVIFLLACNINEKIFDIPSVGGHIYQTTIVLTFREICVYVTSPRESPPFMWNRVLLHSII